MSSIANVPPERAQASALQGRRARGLGGKGGSGHDQHRGAGDEGRVEIGFRQLQVDGAVAVEDRLAVRVAGLADRETRAMHAADRAAARRIHAEALEVSTDKAADRIRRQRPEQRRGAALAAQRNGDVAGGPADLGGELPGLLGFDAVGQWIQVHAGAADGDGGEPPREIERERHVRRPGVVERGRAPRRHRRPAPRSGC